MKKFYQIYQYVAFLIFYPLSIYIWYQELHQWNHVLLVAMMPFIVAYVVPFLGTNVFHIWSFDTRFKLGNMRIYHGFCFGAFANLFGYILYHISVPCSGLFDYLLFGLVSGSFIAFWAWYYDIYAAESGFVHFHNKISQGKTPYEIVTDYAPVYFGSLGFIYGIYLKVLQNHFIESMHSITWMIVLLMVLSLIIPSALYMLCSYIKYKDLGIFGDEK